MKVPPQTFFTFCSNHVALLRALADKGGEISEAEALRCIRTCPGLADELPETPWRRLRELQILVPTEPGSDLYLMAEPVSRLLTYLFNEANPATPEMIRGYVLSLETCGRQLSRALEGEDVHGVGLAFAEITQTLRRVYADLEETHHAILLEVARYKSERERVSIRDKFRRIVHWMERYVEPMIEIVRADGSLRAVFDDTERLLRLARDNVLFHDHPALLRNLRYLRLLGAHALRIFVQCRKEIQPLYDSLRRSSLIAEGAARALEALQNEGLEAWGTAPLVGICSLRFQSVPGDAALEHSVRRVFQHPPEPAPILEFSTEESAPAGLIRRYWLNSLPGRIRPAMPVDDLLGWIVQEHPDKEIGDVLAGFTELLFHEGFTARFVDADSREYQANGGVLAGTPVELAVSR
jgi:hypothetical protein